MKQIILLLTIIFFTITGFAQDKKIVDSLQNELRKFDVHKKEIGSKATPQMDSTKANILYEIIRENWAHNTDSALKYCQQLLTLAENIGYKKGIGNAYNGFGLINMEAKNLQLAMDYYQKALKIRLEINDLDGLAWTYNNMGMVSGDMGLFEQGIKYHLKSLKVKEEIGDKAGMEASYGKTVNFFIALGNYPEALKNCFNILKIAEEIGDKVQIAGAYGGIGNIYYLQGNFPEALTYYTNQLKIGKEIGDKSVLIDAYEFLGRVNYKQGNYQEAIKNYFNSLRETDGGWMGKRAFAHYNLGLVYLSLKDYNEALKNCFIAITEFGGPGINYANTIVNIEIGAIYEKQGNLQEALKYATEGLSSAIPIRAKNEMKEAYNTLAVISADMHNYKAAYEYHVLFQQMKDSIFNDENASKMKGMEMQYDFDKDAAIQKAEQDKKDIIISNAAVAQKFKRNVIYVGLLVIVLFLMIVIILRNKIANERRQRALEQERGRISRDLHDEIGSSLSSVQIMSAFAAESLEGNSSDAKQWMNRIGDNTKESMEKIRDIVWTLNSSTEISGNIITRMNQFISHSLEPKDISCNFMADDKVADVLSDFNLKRNVYLIFKEAVNNIAKYSEAKVVDISLKIENNKLLLTISDDGKGFDTTDSPKGNGLNNMRKRAEQINAILEIKSSENAGTFISLKMVIPHLRYRFFRKAA